jgi:hypothetical protein
LQRWALGGVGALGLGALFILSGCPANLEQPERFEGTGTGTGGSSGSALPACMTSIFGSKCAGNVCHDKGSISNSLDLESPGVASRIIDVAAQHSGLGDAGVSCMPAKLVDTQNGLQSWIYLKLTDMQGDVTTCGSSMPLTPPNLTNTDKACVTTYFTSLGAPAGGTGGTTGSGGTAATTTGGGGAAATTGGTTGTTGGGGATASGGTGGSSAGSGGSGGASVSGTGGA